MRILRVVFYKQFKIWKCLNFYIRKYWADKAVLWHVTGRRCHVAPLSIISCSMVGNQFAEECLQMINGNYSLLLIYRGICQMCQHVQSFGRDQRPRQVHKIFLSGASRQQSGPSAAKFLGNFSKNPNHSQFEGKSFQTLLD